jgi:hypothetical protein
MKNPLKPVCIFFYVACMVYAVPVFSEIISGQSLPKAVENHKVAMTFLCLSLAFIVCYHRKHIFAWYIAMGFYPVIFLVRACDANQFPDIYAFLALLFMYLFSHYYLVPKRDPYKEYIRHNERTNNEKRPKCDNDDIKHDAVPVWKNPLQLVLYIVILLSVFNVSVIIFGEKGIIENPHGIFTNYRQQILFVLIAAIFSYMYWRKSWLAWWIAVFAGPVMWSVYLFFQPLFIESFLISLVAQACIVWYLILRYKSYMAYIYRNQETGDRCLNG